MLKTDFSFDLPEELIAQRPSPSRGEDRLMLLERKSGCVRHLMMSDLPSLIERGTLMVFNDSRVRRARVMAVKAGNSQSSLQAAGAAGGAAVPKPHEFMFIRRIDGEGKVWRVLTGNARKQKKGMQYAFPAGILGTVIENDELLGTEERDIAFSCPVTEEYFEQYGHIPLPPYIKRGDDALDADRYQNVYAKQTGSAACPTAGLHFTDDMLNKLKDAGAKIVYVTLHVGLGTFLPVREYNIEDHKMHKETYTITKETAEAVNRARHEGRPILAVGTTSVRTLEAAAGDDGTVRAGTQETGIFIYPGYKFKAVDQMFTNFHTPQSTLLMLVSAFAGKEHILAAYREAAAAKYRFFSYGDAMLIK